jgi:hypothetical protein
VTAVRAHWAIENRLHWVLDVSFGEGGRTLGKHNVPQNLSLLKKIVLNLIRLDATGKTKASLRLRRKGAAWEDGGPRKCWALGLHDVRVRRPWVRAVFILSLRPRRSLKTVCFRGTLKPTNQAYALAKIAGIEMCRSYNRQYGTQYQAAMPTNLYEPGATITRKTAT